MEIENRTEMLALIHIAKKDLDLDDVAYRSLLEGAAGVQSSAEIKTREQFDSVMRAFGILGFKRKPSLYKKLVVKSEEEGIRISHGQIYYIKGLWELASRTKSEESLKRIIHRIGHVDDIRFLDPKGATAVILTLKDICKKAGYDPDQAGGKRCS